MEHPHVRRAMNCPTTSQFFVNDRRLFRNGITLGLTHFSMRSYIIRAAGGVSNPACKGVCVSSEHYTCSTLKVADSSLSFCATVNAFSLGASTTSVVSVS